MDIFDQIESDSVQGGGDIFDRISQPKQSAISQLGQALARTPGALARGIAEPVVKSIGAAGLGVNDLLNLPGKNVQGYNVPFPGGAIPVRRVENLPKAVGLGLQGGALALNPALSGAAYSGGKALEEGKSGVEIAGQSALGAGLGKALGMASGEPLFTGKTGQVIADKIKDVSKAGSARVINSLIKPLLKDFSYGKNPGLAVAQEGIVANNLDDLGNKILESRKGLGRQIETVLTSAQYQKQRLNIIKDISPIDDAMQTAAKQNNQTLLNRLQETKKAITQNLSLKYVNGQPVIKTLGDKNLSNLTPLEATRIKTEIGNLTKWTGNQTDDQIVNKALKQTYGNIKESIGKTVPAVKNLNERYANLTSAEIAVKYRDKINQRKDLIGLVPKLAGAGEAIQFLSTGNPQRIVEGLIILGVDKVLSSPAFKTRLASGLAKLGKSDLLKVGESSPLIMNFIRQSGLLNSPNTMPLTR